MVVTPDNSTLILAESYAHRLIAFDIDLREDAIARGKSWEAEVRLRRRDGQYRWFLMRSNPLRDGQGRVIRFYLGRTDIEDRKTAERALQRERDRLGLMLDFTNKLVTKLDLRDLLRTVAGSVRRVVPCDLVAIFLPDDSNSGLLRSFVVDFPASKGFILEEGPLPSSKRSISIDETLAGRVFRTGKAWAGTDIDLLDLGLKNDPGLAEGLAGQGDALGQLQRQRSGSSGARATRSETLRGG